MKTLLLLRHAKSSWKELGQSDHDRPLNKRGKRDAPRMGELLREENLVPDGIISSTAKRARRTAERAAESCGFAGEIQLDQRLYFTDPATWFEILHDVPGECQRVMLVGHNPGMEQFLEMLTGESETLPTAALVHITVAVDNWEQTNRDTQCELQHIWRPRELD